MEELQKSIQKVLIVKFLLNLLLDIPNL